MLEVRNLVKCYSTKGGVAVTALDDVTVQFPETGMVFLLGRSGSGKSTLLNVSGGLDQPDSGEIIVKGRSSKDFTAADFDSYRNTFIGFVFQEYNILNEFTVEQNIALALQLQCKPNDKKAVDDLLAQVDLAGMGKRKPNTLSGGQKQRVAIARALIKEPEIIMADEPTGALDSNTGKQVLDTLKKLSETKLVIVVSHDREFAEYYGDRIIELKDGKILSDVVKAQSVPKTLNQNVEMVSEDTISIKNTEKITDEDVKNIVAMLKKNKGEAIISAGQKDIDDVKRACKINKKGNKEYFKDTEEVDIKEYDGKETKFIKSRLPASHAFKMGASGLKTKPIRLIFTILLSVVAFIMFGVVSTFMLYDESYSVSEALREADYPSLMISKEYKVNRQQIKTDVSTGESEVDHEYEETNRTRFGEQELKDRNVDGLDYAGVFNFTNNKYAWGETETGIMLSKGSQGSLPINIKSSLANYYPVTTIKGFTDCGQGYMDRNGFNLRDGRHPTADDEIAITEYVANLFVNTEGSGITSVSDMLRKKIVFMNNNAIDSNKEFTVVGIYSVGQIPTEYDDLKDATDTSISNDEKEILIESLSDYLTSGFNTLIFVSDGFYDLFKDNITTEGIYINTVDGGGYFISKDKSSVDNMNVNPEDYYETTYSEKIVEDNKDSFKLYNLDRTQKTDGSLGENEVLVSDRYMFEQERSQLSNIMWEILTTNFEYVPETIEALSEGGWFYDMYYNGMLSSASDISRVKDFINTYYQEIFYKNYLYNIANKYRWANGVTSSTEFIEAIDSIDQFNNDQSAEQLTETTWTIIETAVNGELKTNYPFVYYSYYAEKLIDGVNNKGDMIWLDNYTNGELDSSGNPLTYSILAAGLQNEPYYQEEKYYEIIRTSLRENSVNYLGYDFEQTEADVKSRFAPKMQEGIATELYFKSYTGETGKLNVVGYFVATSDNWINYVLSTEFVEKYVNLTKYDNQDYIWTSKDITEYVEPEDAKYNYLVTPTDNSQEQIAAILRADGVVSIKINNSVYEELSLFLELITELKQIFFIMGIVFGVFAALMLLNFISVSISAKKRDIGILRAVGARGSDVFKIFFSEAFIIATICFFIATIGGAVVCNAINNSMVTLVSMKLLNFGLINVGLVLAVSFGISIIATFFPVYFAAKKSPVESIRAL